MKLHLTSAQGNQLISGYGNGWVEINAKRYTQSVIVMPEGVYTDWLATDFTSLENSHFEAIAKLKPEVALLGTGSQIRFAHPKLYAMLTNAGIGLEFMDTAAACRTYNILMSEGRNVAAALII